MSKTISFKLSESDTQKLLTLLPSLPSESIHTAAKCLMMFSLLALTSSSTPTPAEAEADGAGGIASQYKLLAIESDIHQVNLTLEQVVGSIEKLALYLSTLSELLLINVGNVSGEAASEAVSEMYQLIFEPRD